MKKYFKLLRVEHYIKNFLIFIPAFFGRNIFNTDTIINLFIAFLSFSSMASFIYIINDIRDCEADRKHEIKKTRPIASGEISVKLAIVISVMLMTFSIISTLFLCKWNISAPIVLLILYLVLNLVYSFGGKKIAIADVLILASGFVIRILYGASVSNVVCSNWLLLTVMSISMYLGLGKRRNELIKVNNGITREVLKKYSVDYLDNMMRTFLTLTLIFYSLWSADINSVLNTECFVWTLPFIIAIVMKYELDIDNKSYGDPVEVVINDKVLISLIICYALLMITLIYIF